LKNDILGNNFIRNLRGSWSLREQETEKSADLKPELEEKMAPNSIEQTRGSQSLE
jgi:hypothetical protein